MLEEYTDHPCAISIKLLVPTTGSLTPAVRTYLRDRKSALSRRGLYDSQPYPMEHHSPFLEIISGRTGNDFYLENDLRKAAASDRYRNGNPHWKRLYNSTVIVPIREPNVRTSENIVGFLCVDSLNAKFDEQVCLIISNIVANTVFYVISSLSQLEDRRSRQGIGSINAG